MVPQSFPFPFAAEDPESVSRTQGKRVMGWLEDGSEGGCTLGDAAGGCHEEVTCGLRLERERKSQAQKDLGKRC